MKREDGARTLHKPLREEKGRAGCLFHSNSNMQGTCQKPLRGSALSPDHGMSPKPAEMFKRQGQRDREHKWERREAFSTDTTALRVPTHPARAKHWTSVRSGEKGPAAQQARAGQVPERQGRPAPAVRRTSAGQKPAYPQASLLALRKNSHQPRCRSIGLSEGTRVRSYQNKAGLCLLQLP